MPKKPPRPRAVKTCDACGFEKPKRQVYGPGIIREEHAADVRELVEALRKLEAMDTDQLQGRATHSMRDKIDALKEARRLLDKHAPPSP